MKNFVEIVFILDRSGSMQGLEKDTTGGFNALLATASINDAIEYHALFKTVQAAKQAADADFQPLNIACVFSPPAEGNKDVQQIQEDLPQEKADNEQEPEKKKARQASLSGRIRRHLAMTPYCSNGSHPGKLQREYSTRFG